jgi:hypothetical protein
MATLAIGAAPYIPPTDRSYRDVDAKTAAQQAAMNGLLIESQANTAGKVDLGILRNDLGSLKFAIRSDMSKYGDKMSPAETDVIKRRIAQAKDMEDRIVANDPAAAKALAAAREESAALMKNMGVAQLKKQGLENDLIANIFQRTAISRQDAAIDKLNKGLEAASAHADAALGMLPIEAYAPK